MTDEAARRAARATEVFNAALEEARAGRVTMSELCAQHNTNPKTVNNHIGRGWLRGKMEIVGGKSVWFFEPAEVQRYARIRQEYETAAVRQARCARGGNKLAQAPAGFVTLIDISTRTGHSMDFMRAAAQRFGFETVRGPKSVIMLREADVLRFIETVEHIPPRPGRQKKGSGRMGIVWTEKMDAALGKESDALLAGRWGVSVAAVRQRRAALDIARCTPQPGAVSRNSGRWSKWTPEMDAELGSENDVVLAKKWNLTPLTVFNRRHKLGIPAWSNPRHISWTPEMDALIGTSSDAHIARRLGVSTSSVLTRRRALGIPAFSQKQSKGQVMAAQLSPALRAKIEEAKPVLLKRLTDLGVTLPDVTDEQVIGFALDQLLRMNPAAPKPQNLSDEDGRF